MRGITEERLLRHRNNDRLDWDTRRAIDIVIRLCPPEELNPWLPIADAPKDRELLLGLDCRQEDEKFYKWVGKRDDTLDYSHATHYQELPKDPK